jgi:glycosyltransferase involved in cell wall biosynthesis
VWVDEYDLKKQRFHDEDMAAIYSALDVLLATSGGEGFGLPVIEAQACGAPVIVTNCTAQPELVGAKWSPGHPEPRRDPSGWVVAGRPHWTPSHASWFAKPDIGQIGLALEDAYQHKGDQAMRLAAINQASWYGADHVFDTFWRPYLAEIGQRPTKMVAAEAKRQRRAERNRKAAA